MTRLTRSHIEETRTHLEHIDEVLRTRANIDLKGVALRTIGVTEDEWIPAPQRQVAVVPITTGGGVIPGFAEAIVAIARHIGLNAGVTRSPDVAGIAEAYSDGNDIVTMADETSFLAINTRSGLIADNERATGECFATLLDMMAGGVRGRSCGVIGCGPIGTHAALRLVAIGANLTLCDLNQKRGQRLLVRLREMNHTQTAWVDDATELLKTCAFVIDATPSAGIIPADIIRPDTVVTAPGVPVGLTPEALDRIGLRFYHDNLPLGVATMLLAAVYGKMTKPTKD